MIGLLSDSRRDRLLAIRETPVTPALLFGLRRVVYTDRDANVRAAAVRRLVDLVAGSTGFADIEAAMRAEDWLLDAIDDPSPLVRDAITRALARCGGVASTAALRVIIRDERMWWLRRSAIFALAAIAGADELATFTRALGDPFWRVRHAAVKVLAVLGAHDPEIRDELLDAPPSSTLAFLRSSWGPVAVEAPVRAQLPSALPPALLDPDPAVVHARLVTDRDVTPNALVELLCDPHEPLRVLASQRLAATRAHDAITAALDWLEEPRIPHVVDTVHHLLDHLGDPAVAIATNTLARSDRPGAGRWAISWVVTTRSESLYDAARERARRGDSSLRREAIPLIDADELVTWAAAVELAPAIATELHDRRELEVLARLDGSRLTRVRALQVDAAARRREWAVVDAAATDSHHAPRAVAARWLVRAGRIDPERFATDPDPSVREAALVRPRENPAAAPGAIEAAAAACDADPWVQRAAMRLLVTEYREAEELPSAIVDAACTAATAPDPVVRQYACRLPGVEPRLLACIVGGLTDDTEVVRSAALESLEHLPECDSRVRAILDDLAPPARANAYSWLVRRLDDPALEFARIALAAETDPPSRRVLAAVLGPTSAPTSVSAGSAGGGAGGPRAIEELPVEVVSRIEPASIEPRRIAEPSVERRPFGRVGFRVAPFAVSGAYDLAPYTLDVALDAGVDLYFWEPGYDRMTKFLRTRCDRARVLTGTYHADPRAIRADVESALRTLRRDTLDGFLLFWTRSPARVDGAAYRVLDDLRREGKLRAIGFSTHHRDLARTAIEATPWDVVMIRHSAAHPGIETELLPTARTTQTAIVVFSALTYGRMLSGPTAPTPAECYRYCLAQPGVTACISAPRQHAELVENLAALAEPSLSAERIAELRAHGTQVRTESQRFNVLLRQPTRDAAAAARELLAAELPPEPESRKLPTSTGGKRSRTRLGRRRR